MPVDLLIAHHLSYAYDETILWRYRNYSFFHSTAIVTAAIGSVNGIIAVCSRSKT